MPAADEPVRASMTPEQLLRPASWAIRTCTEGDIVTNLSCWYYPSVRLTGSDDEARAMITEALAKWREIGVPFAEDGDGSRFYDPDEVINFGLAATLLGADDFWAEHIAPLQPQMLHWFAGKPFSWEDVPDFGNMHRRNCRIELRRTYDLPPEAVGKRLRLKLPLPLAVPHFQVEGMDLHSSVEGRIRASGNRADLAITAEKAGPVELAFSVRASALPDLGTSDELSPEERALYTAGKEGLIAVSPAIDALSQRLAAGDGDPATLVHRYYQYLIDAFVHGRVAYRAIDSQWPTDWPLREGYYDCQIGSALLIALCRARGIPARLVNGYQIFHGYLANHFWAEIWFDGAWRPFDLASWDAVRIYGSERWRSCFAGQTEYRLTLQRFPREILGAGSIGLPQEWHQLLSHEGPATTTQFREARSQQLIYQDSMSIEWGASEIVQGPETE
ncbi:MAG: transglutaminase domain-containing protein [Novosphingobium sp.]|nr:transglutaminase domain-containing protein [Novosphingobium sp.]MCP5403463.1 transglutaminase domain-containing protein [Novosphingobium sp.]